MPNGNSQWRSRPEARICPQQAGAEQGGMGCIAYGKDQAWMPWEQSEELTWDSNPNCGIAREEKKKKERERELSHEKL